MGERRGKKSRRSYGISDHFFVERIYTSGGAAAVFFSRIGKLSRESNERASSIARAFAGKSIYSGAALIRVRIMLRVEFVSNCGRKIRFAAALREYKRTYYRWPIGNWPGMSARAHSRARARTYARGGRRGPAGRYVGRIARPGYADDQAYSRNWSRFEGKKKIWDFRPAVQERGASMATAKYRRCFRIRIKLPLSGACLRVETRQETLKFSFTFTDQVCEIDFTGERWIGIPS